GEKFALVCRARARCLGTGFADAGAFLFLVSLFFCFFSFLAKRRGRSLRLFAEPAPVVWARALLTQELFCSLYRFSFASFLFSRKEKKRKIVFLHKNLFVFLAVLPREGIEVFLYFLILIRYNDYVKLSLLKRDGFLRACANEQQRRFL
ncbi:MAG: hypothetical protein II328_04430, partial [Clostridia bacterium]|nr:hypothetical protein [Clostridia bacterium]